MGTAPLGAVLTVVGLALALFKERLAYRLYWWALTSFSAAATLVGLLLLDSSRTAPYALAIPPVVLGLVWNGLWVNTRRAALPAEPEPAAVGRLARRLWMPLSPLAALTGLVLLSSII